MHFVFVFEGGRESIPFLRFSKQRAADLIQQWMDVKPLCSTKQENIPFALLIDPFQHADTSMSLEWPHYFFIKLGQDGAPIQPKCRWGHCEWTVIYTIGNKFWKMKSVIRPPFHSTKTKMGSNIRTAGQKKKRNPPR